MKNRFLYLSLSLFALFVACEAPKEPKFKHVEAVELISLNKEKAVIRAMAVLENPNSISVKIDSVDIVTFVNGINVGTTTEADKLSITPGTFKLPLQADIPLKEIFNKKNLGGALSALINKKADLKLEGFVYLNLAGISTRVKIDHEDEIVLKKSAVVEE